ncbi:TetR/AcrR family transcriptional regulator [Blastococcus litoris]|uniref:TetR/AcrR family transcriptional regulator n=1 Tax=Blastococcus litoris TaxID=2171622 RepID=UPI0013E05505|nr:TetR/AcrR family transcriptional regulator [Blastococcus litoris]
MSETPDWRARRWAATHQRIYDTALELFQREGFDAVNVGRIARSADVSVPTFYAHYPSKEHLVMQVPSAADFADVLVELPAELPVSVRFRQAVGAWIAQWSAEFRRDALARWQVIATTPTLRTRAAEFERTSGHVVADAMPVEPGAAPRTSDLIVINAYMSAYTAGLLAWADCNGERKLEELMDEAFDALEGR